MTVASTLDEGFNPTSSLLAGADAQSAPRLRLSAKPRWSRRVAAETVGLLDALAVLVGSLLPATIFIEVGGLTAHWDQLFKSAAVTALIVCALLKHWGMYETTDMRNFPLHPTRIIAALTCGFLAVMGLGIPFSLNQPHLWVWYDVWLSASFVLLYLNRIVARAVLANMTAEGRFDTRVAVFGAGVIAKRVHDYLRNPVYAINFVGVYDDRVNQDRLNTEGLQVEGKLEDLIQAGRDGKIDQIVVALPQGADQRMAAITRQLEQLPVSVHVVTHISSDLVDAGPAHRVSSLGPVGLLDVKHKPLADWAPMVKRVEDVVLGGLATLVFAPVMLLIAIAVLIDSPGPILFVQRRRGMNQKTFGVFKFRTMNVLQDGASMPQATKNDPRVTRVGKILRRTSLDELPQLLNVMRGEMSLVGPRPHALVHDEQWGEMLERYTNRHQVKPGITGLAQVNGYRGEMDSPEKAKGRVEHDLLYIQSWSLWLDVKILVRTVFTVFQGSNH